MHMPEPTARQRTVDRLSEKPTVADSASLTQCTLGSYTEVAGNVKMIDCELGDYSYVMKACNIIYTDIGKFANIASEVRINPGNHPVEWVSQHHFLYRCKLYGFADEDRESFFHWRSLQRVTIGHDTWIGHRAIILPGICVGNGAVIGAGSVVSRDVPAYGIVAGVPAKVLRFRFPKAIREAFENIGWWNWDHETLRQRLEDFYDIRRFIHLYGDRP